MVARMKTTIEIPDALAMEAKAVARGHQTTLRDLVVSGLRNEVERRSRTAKADFVFPTVEGSGLRADIAPSEAIAASYDLPS